MARIFSRNLFSNFITSTPTNDTIISPCSNLCDPSCNNFEDCYAFPSSIHPLPPLPPPLPPVSIIVSPDTITTQGVHISPLVIIIVIVLASIFLIISYYAIVIKYCTFWNRTSNGHDQRDPPRPNSDQGDVHALIHENEDRDPVIDHPIWLISTVGLQQSVINAITTLRYKKEDGLVDGTDCSVCLSEFEEDETLRLLPKCKHAFHIDCIDKWLRSHINCPLCRAAIVANSGRPSLASNDPSFGHSRRVELAPMMVDSDSSDIELGRSRRENNSGVVENTDENNVDHNNDQNKDNVDFNSIIKRSFSMDCFRGTNLHNVRIVDLEINDSNSSSTRGIDSSSSSRQQPQGPPPIKRSYSWSERVFLSSRNQIHNNGDVSP